MKLEFTVTSYEIANGKVIFRGVDHLRAPKVFNVPYMPGCEDKLKKIRKKIMVEYSLREQNDFLNEISRIDILDEEGNTIQDSINLGKGQR